MINLNCLQCPSDLLFFFMFTKGPKKGIFLCEDNIGFTTETNGHFSALTVLPWSYLLFLSNSTIAFGLKLVTNALLFRSVVLPRE